MSLCDQQYLKIVEDILDHGYYDQNRTGTPTYKLPHQIMQFDLSKEFPILTTKFVAFKTAVKELLWIFKDQSNDVNELEKQGVNIWNKWKKEDGTIGTCYGWVVKEYKLIDKLIESLKNNDQDRRMMMNIYQYAHLDGGSLEPCCFNTMWDVTDGRLNCMLTIRSNDMPIGNPFNVVQYAVLTHMLSQVTNHKVGLFTVVINNAHIYEDQIEGIKQQLTHKDEAFDAPKFWINTNIKDFYQFTAEDVRLVDYNHYGKIIMPVAE